MNLKKIIFIISLFSFTSCSMIQVGYNLADWLIKKEVLSYVKLYSAQQDLIEKNLDEYMDWHRKVMLPRYIDRMKSITKLVEETDFNTPAGSAALELVSLQLRQDFVDTFTPLAGTTIKPFSTLGEEQVQRSRELIAKKFRKSVKKQKKYTDEEALYVWQENTKDWLGRVNPAQEKWLKDNQKKLLFKGLAKERVTRRGNRNKTFLDIFDEKSPEKRILLQKKYWQQFEDQIIKQGLNPEFKSVIVDYLKLMTPEQKKFFASKVANYQKSLERLLI